MSSLQQRQIKMEEQNKSLKFPINNKKKNIHAMNRHTLKTSYITIMTLLYKIYKKKKMF